jgi:hypothetical protein
VAPEYQALTDADHVVCELRLWRQPRPEANARLIAAAPEMYQLLKLILPDWLHCLRQRVDTMHEDDINAARSLADGLPPGWELTHRYRKAVSILQSIEGEDE